MKLEEFSTQKTRQLKSVMGCMQNSFENRGMSMNRRAGLKEQMSKSCIMNLPTLRKQGGNVITSFVVYGAYVFFGLVLLALLYFGFCEARKAYWDHQVELMCEKDGGIQVIEKAILSRSQHKNLFGEQGMLNIPPEGIATTAHAYYVQSHRAQILKERNPSIRRHEYLYIRRVDKKIIAKEIHYGRQGGDFPIGIGHESSFVCPSNEQSQQSLQSVFLIRE